MNSNFLQGLGKRILHEKRQHKGENMLFIEESKELTSLYQSSYDKKEVPRCYHTRFPRIYPTPADSTRISSTTTKWWSPSDMHKTPLHVLASSQQPHIKENQWKYAYQPSIFSWIATKSECKPKNDT